MGNTVDNPYVPFQITYTYNNPERAFVAETKECNESYPVSSTYSAYVRSK